MENTIKHGVRSLDPTLFNIMPIIGFMDVEHRKILIEVMLSESWCVTKYREIGLAIKKHAHFFTRSNTVQVFLSSAY